MTTNVDRHSNIRGLWFVALAFSCLCSTAAQAEDTGFEVGVRVGYGVALGNVESGSALSDGVSGQIPLALDLGYRVIPNLFIGLYGQYGFGFMGGKIADACDLSSTVSCSAHDIRLGIEAQYHFLPRQKFDPWIGLGVGYEWLGMDISGGGVDVGFTLSGFEFFNLQAGLDIAIAEHFYIAPFLSLSVGEYSSLSTDCSTSASTACNQFGTSGDIPEKSVHEWLMFGVRGSYAP